jgi:hypothetical protein
MPAPGSKVPRAGATANCFFGACLLFQRGGLANLVMKTVVPGIAFTLLIALPLRADLTIVQKVEGGGQAGEMTVKIKGDKARIEGAPNVTTLIDGKTGEMTNLMNDRKTVVRISAEKMKAAAEMIGKFNTKTEPAAKAKLSPTGKKEMIGPYETEQYVCETPNFKATYWLAPTYPEGAAILKQLQLLNPDMWQTSNLGLPDYRDFPALPIKTTMAMGDNQVTTTIVAIKQDPLDQAEFAVPKDFREIQVPEINLASPDDKEKKPAPATSPKQ